MQGNLGNMRCFRRSHRWALYQGTTFSRAARTLSGSGLERKTGAVCLVIGVSEGGVGRPATRAKALKYMYRSVLAGLKTRSPD